MINKMTKDYKIAKERIKECIKNKSDTLVLSNLKINKLPKLIKKCKDHLLYLSVQSTNIRYISTSLYKLRAIFLNWSPIKYYPIISLYTQYSSTGNHINKVEYNLYANCFWNYSCINFIRIIITIIYIQQLYRKYLFYLDFYSVY